MKGERRGVTDGEMGIRGMTDEGRGERRGVTDGEMGIRGVTDEGRGGEG
jgi:hypothetical protein